jgi:alkylation response protein AidB-like acyl-CoA dehydrogenase
MWVGLTTADHEFWKETAVLARKSMLPNVLTWDRAASFPRDLWRTLGRKGLLGIPFPRSYGGSASGITRLAIAFDAFAYGSKDLGIVNSWGVHTAMAGLAILYSGSPSLKRQLLPAMAAGVRIGAFALTEPDAGSHVGAIRTTARRDGDGYILSGRKTFVTNGPIADVFIVVARDGDDSEDRFSAFVVNRGTSGLTIGPAVEKSCIRTSPCGDIELRDCRVGNDHLLGLPGEAMESVILPALDRDRCVVWAGRLGRLRSILEDATAYAAGRVQFGRPIAQHQAVLFKLADIKIRLEQAESLISSALARLERGECVRESAAIARYVLGTATMASADDAMQVFGGYAFYPKNHVERYHRDARLDGIGGGTMEIQKVIIGRQVVSSVDPQAAWLSSAVIPEAWPVTSRQGSGRLHRTRPRLAGVGRSRIRNGAAAIV